MKQVSQFQWILWVLVLGGGAMATAREPMRLLLLSGENNHKWQETTPELVALYQDSGMFEVDVLDKPRPDNFPDLSVYDVVVSNWTNWPSEERVWGHVQGQALLDFVRRGKGFVVFHAASACFAEWPEYQQLVGATWGKGVTGHGPIHSFSVTIADTHHPVTRGLFDFVTTDELWHRMSVQPGVQVLVRAFSSKEHGGTGDHEPVIYAIPFGAGRSFNCVLGHDVAAMQTLGMRLLLLRGTQWAATGKATIETLTTKESKNGL